MRVNGSQNAAVQDQYGLTKIFVRSGPSGFFAILILGVVLGLA
jgi:hypothetical protein